MCRLTKLETHVIRQIDEQIVRPLTERVEAALHFNRGGNLRGARVDSEDNSGIAKALVAFDCDRERRKGRVLIDVVTRQRFKLAMKNRGKFARESVMSPEVGTVSEALVVDFDKRVGLWNEIGELCACRRRGGAFEKNLVPFAHAEFRRATEDSFALITVNLGGFNRFIAERDAGGSEGRFESDAGVRGAAHRLTNDVAAVDFAERSLFALRRLEGFGGDDFADDHAVDKTRDRRDSFDFGGRHRKTVRDEFRVKVGNVDEVGNPIQRDKHERL